LYKKKVSNEIRQHNREKKLSKAEQISLNQDQESIPKESSDTGYSASEKIPVISNLVIEISARTFLPKNSYRKKGAENISQMISDSIQSNAQS